MRIIEHTKPGPIVIVTPDELAKAFGAWEQDFRDEPDAYMSDEQRFAESSENYGEACARHLVKVLNALTDTAKASV